MILSPVDTFETLTSPIRIGPLQLKNRICMPAMHLNMTMGGEVSETLVNFYRERALGGVASITVGGCSIDQAGSGPIMIGLHDDRFIPGLQRLTAAIHEGKAFAIAQLYHAGKYAYSMITGQQAVSASAIRSKLTGETPRALSIEEIGKIQQAFVEASERAVAAGFDGVEILGSAGYLISQFLSPVTNQRDDAYGGSFENRVRFGREIIEKVARLLGGKKGLFVRVAGSDFIEGGNTNAESARVSQIFAEAGADAINVTGGWHESIVPQLTMGVPRGAFLYLAKGIREAVEVPVIASNRFNDPFIAEAALRDGVADLINFGRPLIADPELPRKITAGPTQKIVHCIACNQGCFDHIFAGKPIACTVNPRAGREGQDKVEKTDQPKRVFVVGGGPAGMMAALTAARRGHYVTLAERNTKLGGQLLLAGASRGRSELKVIVNDLRQQLQEEPIELELGVEVTAELVTQRGVDRVILATGATPIRPPIDGVDLPHVVQAWDVLAGNARIGREVAVIGGGAVAVDVAIDLAQRGTLDAETLRFLLLTKAESEETLRHLCTHGSHRVTLIEMARKIGQGIGKSTRWTLIQALKRFDVALLNNTTAQKITEQGVWVETDENKEQFIKADTVILAVGARSETSLVDVLGSEELIIIGDAKSPRRAFDAIHEGYQAALAL